MRILSSDSWLLFFQCLECAFYAFAALFRMPVFQQQCMIPRLLGDFKTVLIFINADEQGNYRSHMPLSSLPTIIVILIPSCG